MNNEQRQTERITAELERVSAVFDAVPETERTVLEPLMQNYAFMKITLEDLQAEILRDGVSETYQNGPGQHGEKESSKLKSYNRLVKNFESVCKTMLKSLPEDETTAESRDPFSELIERIGA